MKALALLAFYLGALNSTSLSESTSNIVALKRTMSEPELRLTVSHNIRAILDNENVKLDVELGRECRKKNGSGFIQELIIYYLSNSDSPAEYNLIKEAHDTDLLSCHGWFANDLLMLAKKINLFSYFVGFADIDVGMLSSFVERLIWMNGPVKERSEALERLAKLGACATKMDLLMAPAYGIDAAIIQTMNVENTYMNTYQLRFGSIVNPLAIPAEAVAALLKGCDNLQSLALKLFFMNPNLIDALILEGFNPTCDLFLHLLHHDYADHLESLASHPNYTNYFQNWAENIFLNIKFSCFGSLAAAGYVPSSGTVRRLVMEGKTKHLKQLTSRPDITKHLERIYCGVPRGNDLSSKKLSKLAAILYEDLEIEPSSEDQLHLIATEAAFPYFLYAGVFSVIADWGTLIHHALSEGAPQNVDMLLAFFEEELDESALTGDFFSRIGVQDDLISYAAYRGVLKTLCTRSQAYYLIHLILMEDDRVDGQSRLHLLQRYLSLGGDPNLISSNGSNALDYALSWSNSDDLLQLLLSFGADPRSCSDGLAQQNAARILSLWWVRLHYALNAADGQFAAFPKDLREMIMDCVTPLRLTQN